MIRNGTEYEYSSIRETRPTLHHCSIYTSRYACAIFFEGKDKTHDDGVVCNLT